MPLELWIGLGLGVWALTALLLASGGRRDRRQAVRSLATLGLDVAEDNPVNPHTLGGPRPIARGTYEGLRLVIEDFVVHRSGGEVWPHTRVRTTETVHVPTFVATAHGFDAPQAASDPDLPRASAPAPLDAALRVHVAPGAERWIATWSEHPALVASAMVRGRGQLHQLVGRDGQLSAVIAGMALHAEQLRPALDAMASLCRQR